MKSEVIIPRLYTEKEAASMMGCTFWTLRNDRSKGRGMRYVKYGKGRIGYRLEDIECYLRGVLVEPTGN